MSLPLIPLADVERVACWSTVVDLPFVARSLSPLELAALERAEWAAVDALTCVGVPADVADRLEREVLAAGGGQLEFNRAMGLWRPPKLGDWHTIVDWNA